MKYQLQQKTTGVLLYLSPRLGRILLAVMAGYMAFSYACGPVLAVEDMWTAGTRIIQDVYGKIAGISTVLAGLMTVVAVLGAKVSSNQHKVDSAWDWLKRIGSTQDISDGEGLEDGKYARGILNACRFKIVLALEEQEALRVQEVLRLSGEETLQILRSHRGEGLLCAGNNRIPVAFYATAKEHEMITTSRLELARQKAEG